MVEEVIPTHSAERAGIEVGERILSVAGVAAGAYLSKLEPVLNAPAGTFLQKPVHSVRVLGVAEAALRRRALGRALVRVVPPPHLARLTPSLRRPGRLKNASKRARGPRHTGRLQAEPPPVSIEVTSAVAPSGLLFGVTEIARGTLVRG